MMERMNIVFLGLSLSSAWGNGHATTFRSLIRGLDERGHQCTFLERRKPWFMANRDMPDPYSCELIHYDSVEELPESHARLIREADAVIVGSYVPDGPAVIDAVAALSPKRFCFYDIDTPVTLSKLAAGDTEYIEERQFGLFDIYFSFSGGENLARIEALGARRAEALYCSVDSSLYQNTGDPLRWDLGYLGTYSPDRQPTLERLLVEPARRLPELRFVVAGAQYPHNIDWPENVDRVDHIPPDQHASFYSQQRFTLNVTRQDMVRAGWSPSVRLFEAASCETPIISDGWRGLDELLPPGEAIIVAEGTDDVVETLTRMREEDRLRIASRAQSIIEDSHTGFARAGELVKTLQSLQTKGEMQEWPLHVISG